MSYRLTVVPWIRGRVTRYEKTEDPRRVECDQELPHPFLSNIRHPYWPLAPRYFVLSVYRENRILILDRRKIPRKTHIFSRQVKRVRR